MRFKSDKIIGYALLAVGLVIILFALNSMWTVFTGARSPPPLITMNSIKISLGGEQGPSGSEGLLQLKDIEILNGEQFSKLVNSMLWYILMLFVASVGGRIGGLGVKLAKEIKVEVKTEKPSEVKGVEVKGE